MPETFDYSTPGSENVTLLNALINDETPYTEDTHSRNAEILKSIINNTEYTDAPQSEIEELLLELKEKIGGEVEIDELNVTENGTYSETGKAYSPVNVNVQPELITKTITANGTYNASSDDADGYSSVTVAIEGYAKKSIANTPTPIATFNASALPMPSLTVGIEAVQSGSGDPSPTNIRPISGWSAVNVNRTGKNLADIGTTTFTRYKTVNINLKPNTYTISATVTSADTDANTCLITPLDGGGNIISTLQIARDTRASVTFTSAVPIVSIRFYSSDTSAHAQGDSATYTDVQLEIGDTPTTYEPYNGTTYTTTLKDGQGNPLTCYGGELSNENGVQTLKVDMGMVDLGTLNWTYRTDTERPIFQATLQEIATSYESGTTPNILCSHYTPTDSSTVSKTSGDKHISLSIDGKRVYVQDSSYTNKTAFKQAVNGVQLVYELATPQTIPQDNLAIATQEGTNNIWADSGDIQSGEYFEAL